MKNPKAIIAIMLCGTACATVLTFVIASCFYPPSTIAETSRQEVWKLLIMIISMCSGYLFGKSDEPKAPEPPKTP